MPIGVSSGNIGYDPLSKKLSLKPAGIGAATGAAALGTKPSDGIMNTLNNQSNGARMGRFGLSSNRQPVVRTAVADIKAQMNPQAPATTGQFSYDPKTDPVYQRALEQAGVNATAASGDAMAALNKRGILDSTITSDRVAGIQQDAISNVETNLMPQLAQQAFQRYQDSENQKNQADQLAIQQGQLTGYYQTPEMKQQYAIVDQAKQDYANAKTPEERIAAHQRAESARGALEQMNANSGLVGSGVTLDQARGNSAKYGVQTQEAIQNEWNRTHTESRDKVSDKQWQDTFDLGSTETMANLTGFLPDGTPTNSKQQQDLANLWTVAANTGKIPDKLADMYGIPHGTQTQAAYQFAKNYSRGVYESDRGYDRGVLESDRNYDLAQDDNDLAWIKAESDMSEPGKTQTVSPAAAGEILTKSLSKVVGTDPQTGKPVYGTFTDWDKRREAFRNAWNTSGVAPGPDTIEMLSKAGYTADEIAKLKDKYPQAFQQAAQ